MSKDGDVYTATFFLSKDSMKQMMETREKLSFFYKEVWFWGEGTRPFHHVLLCAWPRPLLTMYGNWIVQRYTCYFRKHWIFLIWCLAHHTFLKNHGFWNWLSHPFVPITASGTQDEKSLVDGEKFVREVGKLELYLRKKVWLGRGVFE